MNSVSWKISYATTPQLLIYLLGSMSGVKRNWIDGWLESASNTFNAKNSLDDWVKLIMKSFLQCFHEISCYYFPPLGYLNVCYIQPKHFRFVWYKPSLAHYVLLEHYYSMDLKELLGSMIEKKNSLNDKNSKLQFVIWHKNCLRWILNFARIFKLIWRPNPWMNPVEKKYYMY